MESSSSNSEEMELQHMQLDERELHQKCLAWFMMRLKNQDQSVETVSGKLVTPSESHSDDVWKYLTPSESAIIKEALETLVWRRRSNDAYDEPIGDMTELPKSLPKKTYKGDLENKIVMVKIPRCMSWLGSNDAYDEPIEVEETLGISMEVEPLDETQLEDLGLNTYNHDIPLSFREVPSFDELEPQPNPLPNCPSLDVSLGEERGLRPLIKLNSPDSFRMKVVDHLTIHIPPSPHVASFYPRDVYCYYHPCLDDPKKHYGFKPGLLGQSGSLCVDFLDLEVIENDFLGEGYSLPLGPKELENGRIKETHHLEHESDNPDQVDIDILRFFEPKFLAIIYNDPLKIDSYNPLEPTFNHDNDLDINASLDNSYPDIPSSKAEKKALKK
ncbi:hypothetical protein Tco_0638225 [Tanacetum coccineum]